MTFHRKTEDRVYVSNLQARKAIRKYAAGSSAELSTALDHEAGNAHSIFPGKSLHDLLALLVDQDVPSEFKDFLKNLSTSTPLTGWLAPSDPMLALLERLQESGRERHVLAYMERMLLHTEAPSVKQVLESTGYREDQPRGLREALHGVFGDIRAQLIGIQSIMGMLLPPKYQ